MSDVVVSVRVSEPSEERRLVKAIHAFAHWQEQVCDDFRAELGDPDLMVKTSIRTDGLEKTLIFQDRRWAAAFLRFWRVERRRTD